MTRRSGGINALVTLEWLLSSMCHHVPFHVARRHVNITTPVTLLWLFSCVLNPHVLFQVACCDAGKLANCATVKFFSRVHTFVPFQSSWPTRWIFTFIALIRFLPSVVQNMRSEITIVVAHIQCTCNSFSPVWDNVSLNCHSCWTLCCTANKYILLLQYGFSCVEQGPTCLQMPWDTTYKVFVFITAPLCPDSLQLLTEVTKTQFIAADHFPFHNNLEYCSGIYFKSFVIHLTENPPGHLVHIGFWWSIGQNVQKMAIFGLKWPKIHILDQIWPFFGQKS